MKEGTITLGTLLNQIVACCGDAEESEIMDLPIKVKVPHSCGQYSVVANIKDATVNLKWDNVHKQHIGDITINSGYIS